MTETGKGSGWFFMGDYKPGTGAEKTHDKLSMDFEGLKDRLDKLEDTMNNIDNKMDRLIESTKNLISYFSAVNDRDARDLNYKIRGYSSKTKHFAPIGFVPERVNKEL